MAHLIRQSKTFYVDAEGRRVPPGTPGAKKITKESAKWYGAGIPGMPRGKRVPLATDKRVAQRMLDELVIAAERAEAGLPDVKESAQSLEPLIVDFGQAIARKAKPKHVRAVLANVRKVLAGCRITTLGDLRRADIAPRVETYIWSLLEGDEPMTAPTAAYTGKHVKQFCRWLYRKRNLLKADPLAGVDLPSQEVVNNRRALSPDELARLIQSASESQTVFRGLTGNDRAALYLLAVMTGLRVSELAAITAANLMFDAAVPLVRLPGSATKNKKDAALPLSPGAVRLLRPIVAQRPTGFIFPGTWSERAAKMIHQDFRVAKIEPTTTEGVANFHSLRHTFVTLIGQNAPLRVTQELARHSSPILTVGRYSHAAIAEKAQAVAALDVHTEANTNPFSHLSRAQLEAFATAMMTVIETVLVTPLVTLRVTHNLDTEGHSPEQPGTEATKGRRRKPAGSA